MADYPISNVARRIVYTGSAGVGPYAFPFEVLQNTDIKVYKNDVLLTLTTDYTVSISGTLGTGSVTLVSAATGPDRITIVGARPVQRTSDFTTGGDLFANTLNDELDSITIFVQQVAETSERGIKAPVTDPTTINMTLPINTARAGKTLAFDANGDPVAGEPIGVWRGNWASGISFQNRDLVKDTSNSNVYLCIVTHTSTGSLPISTNADSAKWALIVDASAAAASAAAAAVSESNAAGYELSANEWATKTSGPVAGGEYSAKYHAGLAATSASNASTSASNANSAKVAAESARDQTLAAFDSFDDRYLGTKTSDPTLDNDGNALVAGALYFNSVSGVMKVYTGSAWVAAYVSGTGFLSAANNLSDVANVASARTNLGLAIGTNVQAYDAELQAISGLSTNGMVVRTSSSTAASRTITGTTNVISVTNGDGVSGNPTLDVGSLVARTDQAKTFTASQRGTVTTDNDGSFDMSVTNNFQCTPSGTFALTFTNITSGQSGYVLLINTGGHAVTAAATTKVNASFLATVSAAGTHLISYFAAGGNVYCTTSGAMS